jgi:two-component system, OmpR family, response regulator
MLASDTVLIIDDEPDSCLLWTAFLTQMKFKVFTAITLKEGLELVEKVRPAIIFLDNNLPDGLGWDYIDVIRSKIPGCRINLISAFHFDQNRWLKENVNIIEKPVTLSSIKSLLV